MCRLQRKRYSKRRTDFLENTMTFRPLLTVLVLLLPAGVSAGLEQQQFRRF
jgi:hypothetical protein